jgi:hypothetical protein
MVVSVAGPAMSGVRAANAEPGPRSIFLSPARPHGDGDDQKHNDGVIMNSRQ